MTLCKSYTLILVGEGDARTRAMNEHRANEPNGSRTSRIPTTSTSCPRSASNLPIRTRDRVAERFSDPAVLQPMAVDLALSDSYNQGSRALALSIVHTAKQHEAQTLSRLQSVLCGVPIYCGCRAAGLDAVEAVGHL
jgi:hypothetical protein